MVHAQLNKAWSTECMQDVRDARSQPDNGRPEQQEQRIRHTCNPKPRRWSCTSVLGHIPCTQQRENDSDKTHRSCDQWQRTFEDTSGIADTGVHCACIARDIPISPAKPIEPLQGWASSHAQAVQSDCREQLLQATAAYAVLPRHQCTPSIGYCSTGASGQFGSRQKNHRNSNSSINSSDASDAGSSSSGALNDRRLLEMLQLDCRWQAQQLKIKEQQLNDLMQRHQVLLREYLEVKAANQALQMEQQQKQHIIRCDVDAHDEMSQLQAMLRINTCCSLLPDARCLDQLQLVQPVEARKQEPPSYHSSSSNGILPGQVHPIPPLADTTAHRRPPRRNKTWSSAEHLTHAAAAAVSSSVVTANEEVQCAAAFNATDSTSSTIPAQTKAQGGSKVDGVADTHPAVAHGQGCDAALVAGAVAASASMAVLQPREHAPVQLCPSVHHLPALGTKWASAGSLDAAHLSHCSPQKHTPAATACTPKQPVHNLKFAPTPPPHSPSVDGGRARRLREIAKRIGSKDSGPSGALSTKDVTIQAVPLLCSRGQSVAPGCRPWSLDGGLSSVQKICESSDTGGAAAFAAALERYSGFLQQQQQLS